MEYQILHRDIKPTNILTFENNKIFKFADFGMAKINSLKNVMKAEKTILGTELYMSPQMKNAY